MHEYQFLPTETVREFIEFMTASQHWSSSYEKKFRWFDRYLARSFPDAEALTQEMVDDWCAIRDSETINSNLARINVVVAFIRYLRKRKAIEIKEPVKPKPQKCTHIPHAFSKDELTNFFYTCDHINIPGGGKEKAIRKLILCVIFRLMYCTGLRPNEARELKRKDVDLIHGVLNIIQTKGHDQHYVVVHESMMQILKEYDRRMDGLLPARVYFFPRGTKDFYSAEWLRDNFQRLWNEANPSSHAVSYDFRHNYATANINRWIDDGFGFYDKLYYLSKSMGHCSIEHTRYYYSIVPRMAEILEEKSGASFDGLIPEVQEYEDW